MDGLNTYFSILEDRESKSISLAYLVLVRAHLMVLDGLLVSSHSREQTVKKQAL
jgi:hypothetical protein